MKSMESGDKPCKQGTDSSETPKSEHAEDVKTKSITVISEQETKRLKWGCRADIENKPRWYVPAKGWIWVIA
jgi:hypothetical protein